jgi:hypothetical protein
MLMLMRKEGFTFIDRDEYDFETEWELINKKNEELRNEVEHVVDER